MELREHVVAERHVKTLARNLVVNQPIAVQTETEVKLIIIRQA